MDEAPLPPFLQPPRGGQRKESDQREFERESVLFASSGGLGPVYRFDRDTLELS
jgi:hypothetical protein